MASWLVRFSPDRGVQVLALAGKILLCSWGRNFTLTVLLSPQVYRGIHTDVIVYIFAHLRTTLRTEENLLGIY